MNELDKSSWKRRGLFLIVVLALCAASFSAGRFSAPLKVETIDVVRVAYQDRVVEKVVEKVVERKTRDQVVYVDRVVTKEGEVRERLVTKIVEVDRADRDRASDVDETREAEREKVTHETVTLRPDWRVGVAVGASWPKPLLTIYGPLVFGLEADRRIVGGVSIGLRANTSGQAYLAATVEF